MPIMTRNKQGKRTRELSKEVEDPDMQLGQEARYTDLVRCWFTTLLSCSERFSPICVNRLLDAAGREESQTAP
jgi:hypothetical protein